MQENREYYEIREWYLTEVHWGEEVFCAAHGYVWYHRRIYWGSIVHTSEILNVERFQDGWLLHTRNSLYVLLDKTQGEDGKNESLEILQSIRADRPEVDQQLSSMIRRAFLDRMREARKIAGDKRPAFVFEIHPDASYYIVSGITLHGNVTAESNIDLHIGMFQDSVLLCKGGNRGYDFRFFPYGGDRLSFYSWDDRYSVFIQNGGTRSMEVDTPLGNYLIPGGATIQIGDEASVELLIETHIAPAVDKHNMWQVIIHDNGMISYGGLLINEEEEENDTN